mmetsp:Transcript_23232/g.74808  ORF Transcript_23232/g.74808 Transcript_23232/m.74808 type:complete len:251 (-) Transcript_23232:240-992(-)
MKNMASVMKEPDTHGSTPNSSRLCRGLIAKLARCATMCPTVNTATALATSLWNTTFLCSGITFAHELLEEMERLWKNLITERTTGSAMSAQLKLSSCPHALAQGAQSESDLVLLAGLACSSCTCLFHRANASTHSTNDTARYVPSTSSLPSSPCSRLICHSTHRRAHHPEVAFMRSSSSTDHFFWAAGLRPRSSKSSPLRVAIASPTAVHSRNPPEKTVGTARNMGMASSVYSIARSGTRRSTQRQSGFR